MRMGGLQRGPHTLTYTHSYLSLVSSCITSVIPFRVLLRAPKAHDPIVTMSLSEKFCNSTFFGRLIGLSSVCVCVSSRSHGLHRAWQRAATGSYSEKNGPAKPSERRSDPQTSQEKTPTAPSFPQGAHAVLEQGEFFHQ